MDIEAEPESVNPEGAGILQQANIENMIQCAVIYIDRLGKIFYRCSICNQMLQKSNLVTSHFQRHFNDLPFRCHVCYHKFDIFEDLISHVNAHSKSTSGEFIVNSHALTDNEDDSTNHSKNLSITEALQTKHQSSNYEDLYQEQEHSSLEPSPYLVGKNCKMVKSGDDTKMYCCDVCGKPFINKSNLKRHNDTHTRVKRFNCPVCHKGFSHSSYIRLHMNIHRDVKPLQCSVCGIAFRMPSSLRTHMQRHTQFRPHKCSFCEMTFYTAGYLKDHLRSHRSERPFKCIQCDKSFKNKTALRTHSKLHEEEKSYKCKICEAEFAQNAGLYSHMKSHGIVNKAKKTNFISN